MKTKILLVDDSEIIAKLAKMVLEKNYDVETAGDGKRALAELEKNKFDVVLLDFHLPDIEGAEMVKKVKSVSPSTYLIVVSGDVTTYGKEHFQAMGANDALPKEENWYLEVDPLIQSLLKKS